MTYFKHILNRKNKGTPQSQPMPGTPMVPNSAGGFAFELNDWNKLERWLVLGAEGGSYYASERKLTLENAQAVLRCVQADGLRTVQRIVEISEAGRAPKNEPAIFALAVAMAHGDALTRKAAAEALPKVCRIGTHLFHFAEYVNAMRGWGRGLRRAVAHWYTQSSAQEIAFQAVKYQQRDGWSHRDMLRLAHPVAPTDEHNLVFHWITKGWNEVGEQPHPIKAAQTIWAFERAKTATKADVLALIKDYKLPREALPTQWLTDPDIWEQMLPHMGLTALLRNLGNLSKIGLLSDEHRDIVTIVADAITSKDGLKRARIHPIALLTALITYQQGHGTRGSGTWSPVRKIVDALDAAFYTSFGNVEPTGKRIMLALDISGSMSMGAVAGVMGLTPRIASAAMALVTAATERDWQCMGFATEFTKLDISPRQRLDDAVKAVSALPMGGTDCALPMYWALDHKAKFDTFIVYTDSETWAGKRGHPVQALREYREKMGINAKLIVVGMVSNSFTIADPNDAGMLDVVGFDSAVPQVMGDFIRA
ncbi:MAG: TROVE domain-containing protein [Anaerolineae bacterium]|nr:TROVE domain-containing protein [Anaerolineae bacterium]